jgi:hypothetical protein
VTRVLVVGGPREVSRIFASHRASALRVALTGILGNMEAFSRVMEENDVPRPYMLTITPEHLLDGWIFDKTGRREPRGSMASRRAARKAKRRARRERRRAAR